MNVKEEEMDEGDGPNGKEGEKEEESKETGAEKSWHMETRGKK